MNKLIFNKRVLFIDLLRIIACFLVIVNHTNSAIFLNSDISITWFISLTYFFISKTAVPIFIIISGYTMLDREDSYKKILKKLIRIIIILIIFSFIYHIYYYSLGEFNIMDFIISIINKPITNAFWYLYLYIGIILMLPFLQKLVKNMKKKDFYIFFLISTIVFSIYPIIVHYIPILNYCSSFQIPIFSGYIFLLFIGYYLKKYYEKSKNSSIICTILFCLSLVFNVLMTYIEYKYFNSDYYLFYDNILLFPIIVQSVSIVCLIKNIKFNEKISKIISSIGACTFGIYLLSDLLIDSYYLIYGLKNYIHPLFAVIIVEILVFLSAFAVTYTLRKIPIIKKYL